MKNKNRGKVTSGQQSNLAPATWTHFQCSSVPETEGKLFWVIWQMERNLIVVTMETSKKYPKSRPENLDLAYSPLGISLHFFSGSIAKNPTWVFPKEILSLYFLCWLETFGDAFGDAMRLPLDNMENHSFFKWLCLATILDRFFFWHKNLIWEKNSWGEYIF